MRKTRTAPASPAQADPAELFQSMISPPTAPERAVPVSRRTTSRPRTSPEASPETPSAEPRGSVAPRKSKKERPSSATRKDREPRRMLTALVEHSTEANPPVKAAAAAGAWPSAKVVGRPADEEQVDSPAVGPWDRLVSEASPPPKEVSSPVRARRWSPRNGNGNSPGSGFSPLSLSSPTIALAQEGQMATFGLDDDELGSPTKARKGLQSPTKLGEGDFGVTFGSQLCTDTAETGISDNTFDVTFGRGGLDCITDDSPKGRIVDEKKAAKKALQFTDTTFTDHAVVVKPKAYKTLNDVAPGAGFDFDATKGLAALGSLRAAANGKRGQKEAVVRLPRAQEWQVDDKRAPGRPRDWALAARELSRQSVLGTAARDVSTWALLRWYLPYMVCAGVGFGAAAVLVGRSEFLALQLPILLTLLAAHLIRIQWWDKALQDVVDHCTRDEVKRQLHAPLGWGEGTANFSGNLTTILQAAIEQQGPLLRPVGKSRWRQPFILASLSLGLLSVVRLARLGMNPEGMWANVWQSLEVIAAVGAILIFVFVGCTHNQAGSSRKVEANLRVEALEAAFNSMLDVMRPLLGPGAVPIDFGCSAGIQDLATTVLSNKLFKSTHFSVRLVSAEGQTIRTTLILKFGAATSITASCSLAGFSFAFGGAETAMATDLGDIGNLGVESALSAAANQGTGPSQSWAAGLIGRFRSEQPRQEDAVSISIGSASTACTLKSKRTDTVDEFSLHLVASMLRTLSARREYPMEVFRAGHLGGLGIMAPKAAVEEPCLVLGIAVEKMLWAEPHLQGKGPAARLPTDELGVLRDSGEMSRLLRGESRQGGSPRSSCASNGSALTLSSAEESGSPSFGMYNPKFTVKTSTDQRSLGEQRHLAILFDTYAERDLCLSVLRSIGFIPRFGEP